MSRRSDGSIIADYEAMLERGKKRQEIKQKEHQSEEAIKQNRGSYISKLNIQKQS